MKKKNSFCLVFLPLFFVFNSCSNNTEPAGSDNFEIRSQPVYIDININPDSLQIEHSPIYSVNYSALKKNGAYLTSVKYHCPDCIEVDREFVIERNDSFVVEIKNCKNENDWLPDLGSIEKVNSTEWINSEVKLLRTEKTINNDNTINFRFTFETLKQGKGYISFVEKNSSGEITSDVSHGLLIGYSTNALNKVSLHLDEIIWKYNVKKGTFSTVSVKLKGSTNVYRIRGLTAGDGVLSATEIPVKEDNSFEVEYVIGFSNVEGITLKNNSGLYLYGAVGKPKFIPLVNPKSEM